MTSRQPQEWTEENEAALRELHAAGLSFSQIARDPRIGKRSKNSCIGKALRLGLPSRSPAPVEKALTLPHAPKAPKVSKPPKAPPVPRKPAAANGTAAKLKAGATVTGDRMAPEAIRQPIPDQRAEDLNRTDLVQLMDLKAHHCRWPIRDPGDPLFGFCGHRKEEGRVYCEGHSRIAYQPTPVRNSTKELIRSVRRFT